MSDLYLSLFRLVTHVPFSISSNLSGNKNNLAKNTADKTDKYHSMLYRAEDIRNDPTIALSRPGMILFALLSGGDYHKVRGAFPPKASAYSVFLYIGSRESREKNCAWFGTLWLWRATLGSLRKPWKL